MTLLTSGRYTPPGMRGIGPHECCCEIVYPWVRRIPCWLDHIQMHHLPVTLTRLEKRHYRMIAGIMWTGTGAPRREETPDDDR